ncbi:MAG: hypothetical protein NZ874_03095 [Fimbriimonadales bacterium]|nr:hypothetical protein [Fimbriimonadales bacterium]
MARKLLQSGVDLPTEFGGVVLQGEAFYAQAVSNRMARLFRAAYRCPCPFSPYLPA